MLILPIHHPGLRCLDNLIVDRFAPRHLTLTLGMSNPRLGMHLNLELPAPSAAAPAQAAPASESPGPAVALLAPAMRQPVTDARRLMV